VKRWIAPYLYVTLGWVAVAGVRTYVEWPRVLLGPLHPPWGWEPWLVGLVAVFGLAVVGSVRRPSWYWALPLFPLTALWFMTGIASGSLAHM